VTPSDGQKHTVDLAADHESANNGVFCSSLTAGATYSNKYEVVQKVVWRKGIRFLTYIHPVLHCKSWDL
jgi:hypothetical protein